MTSVKLKDGKQCNDILPKSERIAARPIIVAGQDKDRLCSIGPMTAERYDSGIREPLMFTDQSLSYRYVIDSRAFLLRNSRLKTD